MGAGASAKGQKYEEAHGDDGGALSATDPGATQPGRLARFRDKFRRNRNNDAAATATQKGELQDRQVQSDETTPSDPGSRQSWDNSADKHASQDRPASDQGSQPSWDASADRYNNEQSWDEAGNDDGEAHGEGAESFWDEPVVPVDNNLDRTMPKGGLKKPAPLIEDATMRRPMFADDEDDRPRLASKKRQSLAEGPDWSLPMEEIDPYKELLLHRIYYGKDPFALLTNAWLEGSEAKPLRDPREEEKERLEDAGGEEDEPVPEDEQMRREREKTEEAERNRTDDMERETLRIEELLNDKAGGWKLWLRGRDLRSEFLVESPTSPTARKAKKIREFKEREEREAKQKRTVKGKSWIRAPVDAREPKGELTCWRADLVQQARFDADQLGLERATIEAEHVRELSRKDWSVIDKFYWYVEAVDLDGIRYLWSPTFVGFLWEYWQRSNLGKSVMMPEIDLEIAAQNERLRGLHELGLQDGLFPRKPVNWARPIWKPPHVDVPGKVFHILEKPDLPPLPRRFPHRLFYKDGQLERTLAANLEGTEAWDAMLGTSDRLQGAARSILSAQAFSDKKLRLKADARDQQAVPEGGKTLSKEPAPVPDVVEQEDSDLESGD
jgi:hypothetical protein